MGRVRVPSFLPPYVFCLLFAHFAITSLHTVHLLYCRLLAYDSLAAHTLSFHCVWTLDTIENLLRNVCVLCLIASRYVSRPPQLRGPVASRVSKISANGAKPWRPNHALTHAHATRTTRTARPAAPCAALWRGAARLLAAAAITCRRPTQWCVRAHSLISACHTPMAARTHARC